MLLADTPDQKVLTLFWKKTVCNDDSGNIISWLKVSIWNWFNELKKPMMHEDSTILQFGLDQLQNFYFFKN